MESSPKKTVIKKIEIVFGLLVGLIVFLFLIIWGWQKYQTWKFNHDLAVLQAEEERPYREDTYGGKTPKETLELFIAAVEKGDYDLASKYFILSKQEEWNKRLKNGDIKKIKDWIAKLKEAQDKGSVTENRFQMYVKGSDGKDELLIDFIKYPQGIWKIDEV
jgi:hypothetical protein